MEQYKITNQLNNGSKNYSAFIHSFTTFLIHYFDSSSTIHHSKNEKLSGEKLIAESLLLLEKLHMHIFYSFCIYEKHFNNSKNPLQSNTNFTLLKQLQQKIKNYHFSTEESKTLCENIISQILNYYPQSNSQIKIILSPISPPWIADL